MKKLLAISALVGAGLVLTTSAVMAYRGDPGVFGPNHTEERHKANQIRTELGLGQRLQNKSGFRQGGRASRLSHDKMR